MQSWTKRPELRTSARENHAFYGVATDSVGGSAGELLRFESFSAQVLPRVPVRARAWRILYRSTSAVGVPVLVSGTVLVPHTRYHGPRPLIGYAIGTQGLGKRCAPSLQLQAGTEYETLLIAAMLRRGWAVALTDYPGLGTGGGHPYVVGRALGPTVLDSMRAARALPDAGLTPDGPAAIFGYSEGGTAAGWAAQLQPTYAPDIPLTAVAIGGAAADLTYSSTFLEGGRFAWLQVYASLGYDIAYPELDFDSFLNDRGRRMAAQVADSHVVWQAISRFPFKFDRRQYLVGDPLSQPEWLDRLRENRLGDIAPAAPVLLTHGRLDQAVGYGQAPRLCDDWAGLGVDVTYRSYYLEHVAAGVAHMRAALPWLAHHLTVPRYHRSAA